VTPHSAVQPTGSATGRYRWRICALLFCATTLNYIDRQVLGILAPDLQRIIGWNEIEYGYIITAFQAAYAIGLLIAGRAIDRIGARAGYAVAISIWSIAAMAHAAVRSAVGFGIARFGLGLGESGNFPAAIKTVAEWFPSSERAFVTGIFNSGSNVGAIIAPLMVPLVTVHLGWRWAFLITGVFSATWLIFWLRTNRVPGATTKTSAGPRWSDLIRVRQTWAFVIAKTMTDPVWWFLLFWLPKFLNAQHGLTLTSLGPPLIVIYLLADAGSIGGGWFASRLLRVGWSANRARKTAMLLCAVGVIPIVFASRTTHVWTAVALIGIAAGSHQGWSANLFTVASDLFPRDAVASVVGIGGFAGAVGGMLMATLTGLLLELTHSYALLFIIAGSAYVSALLVFHAMAPRMDRVPAAFVS
jgi:ACS family hexuronate transporter-like MFS transporter